MKFQCRQFLELVVAAAADPRFLDRSQALDLARKLGKLPATSFCEYSQTPDPVTKKKPKIWFAIDESQPLFFFAGT